MTFGQIFNRNLLQIDALSQGQAHRIFDHARLTGLYVQEMNQMLSCIFNTSFTFQLHLLLPGTVSRELHYLIKSARDYYGTADQVESNIRQTQALQLLVNLFNVGHRNVIYCINQS